MYLNSGTAREDFESLRFYVLECRLLSCDHELFVSLLAKDIPSYSMLKISKSNLKLQLRSDPYTCTSFSYLLVEEYSDFQTKEPQVLEHFHRRPCWEHFRISRFSVLIGRSLNSVPISSHPTELFQRPPTTFIFFFVWLFVCLFIFLFAKN